MDKPSSKTDNKPTSTSVSNDPNNPSIVKLVDIMKNSKYTKITEVKDVDNVEITENSFAKFIKIRIITFSGNYFIVTFVMKSGSKDLEITDVVEENP